MGRRISRTHWLIKFLVLVYPLNLVNVLMSLNFCVIEQRHMFSWDVALCLGTLALFHIVSLQRPELLKWACSPMQPGVIFLSPGLWFVP